MAWPLAPVTKGAQILKVSHIIRDSSPNNSWLKTDKQTLQSSATNLCQKCEGMHAAPRASAFRKCLEDFFQCHVLANSLESIALSRLPFLQEGAPVPSRCCHRKPRHHVSVKVGQVPVFHGNSVNQNCASQGVVVPENELPGDKAKEWDEQRMNADHLQG